MSAERVRAWVSKAENDLLSADNNLASVRVPYDVVCYHSQQAAEKCLKGLVVHLGVQPIRTHDLLALLQEARKFLTNSIPEGVENSCIVLNPYAVEVRYPDDDVQPTVQDANEAREAAEVVYRWVLDCIAA